MVAGLVLLASTAVLPAASVGQRPYELDWAGRVNDDHPPLVDFENLDGWRVECRQAQAAFTRSEEQRIWGAAVGKLVYRSLGANPEVRLLPPQPIPIRAPFDAVTLWCYGNNWGYAPDPTTPPVRISALFEDAAGQEFAVYLYQVDWTEWYLLHRRLEPAQIERVKAGARFKGLLITNGKNKDDRALYFDNLAVFTEVFPPLTFEPRPARGVAMLPGQNAGANTGPGRLPFPTRPETILPPNLTGAFSVTNRAVGAAWEFTYRGEDGTLVFRYTPRAGTWSDWEAAWTPPAAPGAAPAPAVVFRPCEDGGVWLATAAGPALPQTAEHLGTRLRGDALESRWRLAAGGVSAEVTYVYRLWNKSLVADVLAPGGQVAEVRYGRATGLAQPRLVTNPFYPAEGGRPAVVVSGPPQAPLFVAGNTDWYLANGSVMWAANAVLSNGVVYNGGTRYIPLTHGKRNDCFERFFITVSPRYEEVLPVIPNPVSPWKHVTGTRLWRAHGASNRQQDAAFWTECHRYGMTQVVVTDHETMWRDGGESFTFRTRAAPGKGGDAGAFEYARLMQDQLGFVYGPYNNFTDFAPVNEHWSTDLIARDPQNQLQHAWMRCYAPKPARAVEYCAKLAPRLQEKFRFSTAYCDVHTAVPPWHRVDYDPRAPGAGTFAAVFYAYGEIMLLQKQAWNGPVYSEGNYHCFYMGLTDGNYGQDQSYQPAENPWLVDFDLRRMHDLGCNFGMGNPEMFYANRPQPRATPEQRDAWLDRFLAATVAFGHPGFLVYEDGLPGALRSYYLLQQLHSRYCLTNAADIRYADAAGNLLETSAAVASGAYRRSQVVTRYADGTITAANGSRSERMTVQAFGRALDLPPNGYAGWTADGAIEVFSGEAAGHRADYAATPAYLYVDGRGRFTRFARAGGDGPGVCRFLGGGTNEIILLRNAECGFAVTARAAVALDRERKVLGPAELRTARGLTYVVPVEGAFSYRLTEGAPGPSPHATNMAAGAPALACDRDLVVPGEEVTVRGQQTHRVRIPGDAKPGQRLWMPFEGAWIDFTVVPLAEVHVELAESFLNVRLASHLARAEEFRLRLGATEQRARLEPERPAEVRLPLEPPTDESAEVLALEIRAGSSSLTRELGLVTTREPVPLASVPAKWTGGMQRRGQTETENLGTSGTVIQARHIRCGEVGKDGLFMHPPWQGAVGYCFALFEPISLPARPPAALRCVVGKENDSDPGDGIAYRLVVVDASGAETVAARTHVTNHAWTALEADLTPWAGQRVRLKFITDVGPRDNSSGDWGCWADWRVESLQPQLHRRLLADVERLRREPAPLSIQGLTREDVRRARGGLLRYEGRGIDGGRYQMTALLNGLEVGAVAPAHAGERAGQWAAAAIPLPAAVIRALDRRNHLVVRNPNRDHFAIRRFALELELADGRRCASDVSTATFTQPPGWPSHEGIKVPFEEDITVDLWLPLRR